MTYHKIVKWLLWPKFSWLDIAAMVTGLSIMKHNMALGLVFFVVASGLIAWHEPKLVEKGDE